MIETLVRSSSTGIPGVTHFPQTETRALAVRYNPCVEKVMQLNSLVVPLVTPQGEVIMYRSPEAYEEAQRQSLLNFVYLKPGQNELLRGAGRSEFAEFFGASTLSAIVRLGTKQEYVIYPVPEQIDKSSGVDAHGYLPEPESPYRYEPPFQKGGDYIVGHWVRVDRRKKVAFKMDLIVDGTIMHPKFMRHKKRQLGLNATFSVPVIVQGMGGIKLKNYETLDNYFDRFIIPNFQEGHFVAPFDGMTDEEKWQYLSDTTTYLQNDLLRVEDRLGNEIHSLPETSRYRLYYARESIKKMERVLASAQKKIGKKLN